MRIRATVAALTGTLALSALAVPAAHAVDGPSSAPRLAAEAAQKGANAGSTKITKVSVNGGKDVVIGTSNKVKFKIAVTATDPSGIAGGSAFLYHGSDIDHADGVLIPDNLNGKCTVVNSTTSTCTLEVVADPKADLYTNGLAGSGWKLYAAADGNEGGSAEGEQFKSDARFQRYAKLTTNASPEPIKKGKTLTVTGALTRANWETSKYAGYTAQSVQLQYKKKGASSYTTLKTVKSDSKGNLKTTVKASADGYFRYVFAGTSTTPSVTSTSDYVDVQ
ncbi:calcium-binding protein [Streptomyces sp. NPDC052114]|uniref:calcium-binding protein n=1 Tax=unclassified Streptomyces TaxID=2593676 RepID=UPI00341E8539